MTMRNGKTCNVVLLSPKLFSLYLAHFIFFVYVEDIGYIRVQYAPVIARVCGFARGAAESKKPQTSVITGVYCTSMHPISDLLP